MIGESERPYEIFLKQSGSQGSNSKGTINLVGFSEGHIWNSTWHSGIRMVRDTLMFSLEPCGELPTL